MSIERERYRTYDYELTLVKKDWILHTDRDPEEVEIRETILCDKKSIGRSEFYQAAAASLRPSYVFIVHGYEYDGQKTVEFEGDPYNVIRTYAVDFEELELTCELIVGGDADDDESG